MGVESSRSAVDSNGYDVESFIQGQRVVRMQQEAQQAIRLLLQALVDALKNVVVHGVEIVR